MNQNLKKKLIFRSWHRGIKEADLLLGTFADRYVPNFNEEQIHLYQDILSIPDQELVPILYQQDELPKKYENKVMTLLINFVQTQYSNDTNDHQNHP